MPSDMPQCLCVHITIADKDDNVRCSSQSCISFLSDLSSDKYQVWTSVLCGGDDSDHRHRLLLVCPVLHGSSVILMTSDIATSRVCKIFFIQGEMWIWLNNVFCFHTLYV